MRSGAVLSASGRIVVTIAGAATTVVVGRILGPAGFGVYSVSITLIVVLQVLTTLGVETGIVYYVSSGAWALRSAFHTSQRVALVCGVCGICAALIAHTLIPQVLHGLTLASTLIAAAAVPFLLSWLLGAFVALAAGDYATYITPSVIKEVFGLLSITGLALWKGVLGAILGLTLAHVVAATIDLALVRRVSQRASDRPGEPPTNQAKFLTRAVRFGIKGSASNALQTINLRLDTFVLNAGVSSAVVGHYGLAVSITSVMTILPGALKDALFPRAAALHGAGAAPDHAALRVAEQKSLRHSVVVTGVAALACVGGLLLLVVPVYGADFRPTIALGLILLPGAAVLGVSSVLVTTIVARGRPDVPLRVMLGVTPATVALYVTFVPAFHAVGAAAASSISYLTTFGAMCWWYRRITGYDPIKTMRPTLADLADYWDLLAPALDRAGFWRVRRKHP